MPDSNRITGKLDVVNIMRERSREKFTALPKQQRINSKLRKQPRYKLDWRKEQ